MFLIIKYYEYSETYCLDDSLGITKDESFEIYSNPENWNKILCIELDNGNIKFIDMCGVGSVELSESKDLLFTNKIIKIGFGEVTNEASH